MNKIVKYILIAVAAIVVIGLFILAWRYYNCLNDEGKPCSDAARTVSGSVNVPIPGGGTAVTKRTKCNFLTGKTCS